MYTAGSKKFQFKYTTSALQLKEIKEYKLKLLFDLTINSKTPELLRTMKNFTVLFSILTPCSLVNNNEHF